MLARRNIQWREKVGKNDIATVDRAMGTLKDMIARRSADEAAGGDWLTELPKVIKSYNKLDHSALHQNAPGEVKDNTDLRFQLRYENAEKRMENAEQAQERKRKLETAGAFRTLLQPTAFKRRAGCPIGPAKSIQSPTLPLLRSQTHRATHTTRARSYPYRHSALQSGHQHKEAQHRATPNDLRQHGDSYQTSSRL